jgi:hypothetical protein
VPRERYWQTRPRFQLQFLILIVILVMLAESDLLLLAGCSFLFLRRPLPAPACCSCLLPALSPHLTSPHLAAALTHNRRHRCNIPLTPLLTPSFLLTTVQLHIHLTHLTHPPMILTHDPHRHSAHLSPPAKRKSNAPP